MNETRKKMLEAINKDAYNGVDLFEGTTPMRSGGGSQQAKHGALKDMDPNDPGVDISGIMKIAGGAWGQLKQKKVLCKLKLEKMNHQKILLKDLYASLKEKDMFIATKRTEVLQ